MLKVVKRPQFTTMVTILEPSDGGQKEGKFKARFQVIPRSELKNYDLSTADGTDEFLRDAILGWFDLVEGEEGDKQPFEFNSTNLNTLLDLDHYRVGFTRAYFDNTSGIQVAKRGN